MAVAYLAGSFATVFAATSVGAYSSYAYNSGASGADRLLVVSVVYENGIPGPTGITYNGVSLTKSLTVNINSGSNFSETLELWTLTNPSTGSNTLAFSGSGGSQDAAATAAVYTGVDQASPIGNTATNSALAGTEATSVSITKQAEDNLIAWAYVYARAKRTFSVVADNTTLLVNADLGTSDAAGTGYGAGYREVGSGSVLVGVTRASGTSQDNGIAAIELVAAGAGGLTLIGKNLDARWDMLNSAGNQANVQWAIVNAVQQSADLQWGTLNAAGKSVDLQHAILNAVGKSSDLRWDILSALASVGKSLDARWGILNATSKDIDLRWDALMSVTKGIDARWDILTTASHDIDAQWSILNTVFKDADLRYSLLEAVSKDIDLRWDVLSSKSAVGRGIDLQWSILATVSRSLDSRWDILGSVGADADMRWEILKAVSNDADLQWALLQSAGKQVDIRWDQLATTGKDISLRWSVLSDDSFPDITGTITVNSVTKKITLSSATPIITVH